MALSSQDEHPIIVYAKTHPVACAICGETATVIMNFTTFCQKHFEDVRQREPFGFHFWEYLEQS